MSQSSANGGDSTAVFVSKVWKIVNDPETDDLISWSESGKTFVVHNESAFAKQVVPHHFKHNNFTSFVRQLNQYGFRKVAKPGQGGLYGLKDDSVEFWHTNFRRGHPELLQLVQKKAVSKVEEKQSEVSRVMSDIHQMKEKQESIGTLLDDLKDENYYLKQEIMALKQKHDIQHKLLNKIIHFVIQMVYKGRPPLRKNRLMLTGAENLEMLPLAKRSNAILPDPLEDLGINSPSTLPVYDVSSPDIPTVQSIPTFDSNLLQNDVQPSAPQDDPLQLPILTNNPPDLSSGDEFLADLLSSSMPSQTTPTSSAPHITSVGFSAPDPLSPSSLLLEQSSAVSQPIIPPLLPQPSTSSSQTQSSATNQVQPSSGPVSSVSQSVDLVPYTRMNDLAAHLENQQAELNSLPDTLLSQLEIDPTLLSGLLTMDYTQAIPEYDVVDTARLLESFIDPNPETDICHESTVQVTPALQPTPALALPPPGSTPSTTVVYVPPSVTTSSTTTTSLTTASDK